MKRNNCTNISSRDPETTNTENPDNDHPQFRGTHLHCLGHDYGQPHFSEMNQAARNRKDQDGSCSLPSKLMTSRVDQISSQSNGSAEVTRCVCGSSENSGRMICCDSCDAWQHVACIGLSNSSIPDRFYCNFCMEKDDVLSGKLDADAKRQLLTSSTKVFGKNTRKYSVKTHERHNTSDEEGTQSEYSQRELTCDCLVKLTELLNFDSPDNDTHPRGYNKAGKQCFSFTLKSGQKILKSSRLLKKGSFICELRCEIHVLGNCSYTVSGYNAFSTFTFTINSFSGANLALDTRGYNHFSRYIRRSCFPNAGLVISKESGPEVSVKTRLYALADIHKCKEITIAVDRSDSFFADYSELRLKYRWHKHDYMSSLTCQCKSPGKKETESVTRANSDGIGLGLLPMTTNCSIEEIRELIKSYKFSQKPGPVTNANSPYTDKESDKSSDDSANRAEKDLSKRLTREERKMEYVMKIINKMEKGGHSSIRNKALRREKVRHHSKNADEASLAEEGAESVHSSVTSTSDNKNAPIDNFKSHPPEPASHSHDGNWFIPQEIRDVILNNRETIVEKLGNQTSWFSGLQEFQAKNATPAIGRQREMVHCFYENCMQNSSHRHFKRGAEDFGNSDIQRFSRVPLVEDPDRPSSYAIKRLRYLMAVGKNSRQDRLVHNKQQVVNPLSLCYNSTGLKSKEELEKQLNSTSPGPPTSNADD